MIYVFFNKKGIEIYDTLLPAAKGRNIKHTLQEVTKSYTLKKIEKYMYIYYLYYLNTCGENKTPINLVNTRG